jgi:uracil phosphoribosyltransferase
MKGVTVVDHPLVQHKLTLMRKKDTSTKSFRQLLKEIGGLLCYEVTRDLPLDEVEIETPITTMKAPSLSGKKLVFAAILRSGMGMLDGMLELVPAARIAHVGLYRDPATLACVEYYFKAPAGLGERTVIVVDPMLATGNTAIAAIDRLKEAGAKTLRMVCLLASPEGLSKFRGHRRAPQRPRLHRPRPRRRRRPHVRHPLRARRTFQGPLMSVIPDGALVRARRSGDCVGSSVLFPGSASFEHAVGRDDDLPGDGDEGHFGGLTGLTHGLVLALEAVVGSHGADRGQVEGGAHTRTPPADVGLAGSCSALVGMRGKAGEAGDGLAVEAAQLWQVGHQGHADGGAYARNGLQQVRSIRPGGVH